MRDELALSADGTDVLIDVWTVPGAKRSEVVGVHGGALRVRVAAPPSEGRANRELVAVLTGLLETQVILEKGSRGRSKRLRIQSRTIAQVLEAIERVAGGKT